MTELQLTQEQVAERMGYTQGAFGHWLNRRREPTLEQFGRIAAVLGVSPPMLVYGVEPGGPGAPEAAVPVVTAAAPPPGYLRLRLLDVRGVAGHGAEVPEVLPYLDILESHVRQVLRVDPAHLRVATAWGDSMAGTILHNDLMAIDISQQAFRGPAIYLFDWGGLLKMKRLSVLMDGRLEVRSDNPAYTPEYLRGEDAERLRIVGRLAGVLSLRAL